MLAYYFLTSLLYITVYVETPSAEITFAYPVLCLFSGCSYNPAVPMPRVGWPIPPRPQPWLGQRPAVSVPQPGALGMVQQPLFPVQNFRPPMPSTTSPGLQPSLTAAPPVLPVSTPATVSQPLFPVVANHNISTQAPPFSAPLFPTNVPLSSSAEHNSSTDLHGSNISSLASSYHTPGFPGTRFVTPK